MPTLVHLAVAPEDGFEKWTPDQWDAWLDEHPWEPAELLSDRGDWLIFLYMTRVHAKRTGGDLAPYFERLISERPFSSKEIDGLKNAFDALRHEFAQIPAAKLFTGTQFYTPEELESMIDQAEEATGRKGAELTITDLWRTLFGRLERVFLNAREQGRGVFFGHIDSDDPA